jgi:hypothetical protein
VITIASACLVNSDTLADI